jgi:hypothetical protein
MGTALYNQDNVLPTPEDFLLEVERKEIDRQFAVMAEDEAYQALNEQIAEEFSESDWEAWVVGPIKRNATLGCEL